MIENSVIRNCTTPFPATQLGGGEAVLGKILIKNIYPEWQGSPINIKSSGGGLKLRIGSPNVDRSLRNDGMFFVLDYLSYNPILKLIEKRDLTPYRNVCRISIGNHTAEREFEDSVLFVSGLGVVEDLRLLSFNQGEQSVADTLRYLINKVETLQREIINLKNSTTIYTKASSVDEFIS